MAPKFHFQPKIPKIQRNFLGSQKLRGFISTTQEVAISTIGIIRLINSKFNFFLFYLILSFFFFYFSRWYKKSFVSLVLQLGYMRTKTELKLEIVGQKEKLIVSCRVSFVRYWFSSVRLCIIHLFCGFAWMVQENFVVCLVVFPLSWWIN